MADLTKVERTWCLELLAHGIEHCRRGSESDRCFALIAFDNALDACALSLLRQSGKAVYTRGDRTALFLEMLSQRKIVLDGASVQRVIQKRNEIYHNGAGVGVTALFVDMARSLAMSAFEGAFKESADIGLTERDLDRAFGAASATSLPFSTLDALNAVVNLMSRFAWLVDKDPKTGWLQSAAGAMEEWNIVSALNDGALSAATADMNDVATARDAALAHGLGGITETDAAALLEKVNRVQLAIEGGVSRVEIRRRFSERYAALSAEDDEPRAHDEPPELLRVPAHWTSVVLNVDGSNGSLSARTSDGLELASESFQDLGIEQEDDYSPVVRSGLPMNENVQRFLGEPYFDDYRRLLTTLIGSEYGLRADAAREEFLDTIDAHLPELGDARSREELLKYLLLFHERQLEHFEVFEQICRGHIHRFYPAVKLEKLIGSHRDAIAMWVRALKHKDEKAAEDLIKQLEEDLRGRFKPEASNDEEEGGAA